MLKHARPIVLDEKVAEPRQRIGTKDSKKSEPWIERQQTGDDANSRDRRAKIVKSSLSGVRVAVEIVKPKLREGGRPLGHAVDYLAFFFGTFLPFFRDSERPIAMACLRLVTLLPLLPLFREPR